MTPVPAPPPAPAPEAPAYRPEQLLSARHDTPDQTGAVTDWEPVAGAAPAPEVWDASVPPGGYVCSACGWPVESEPCPDHGAPAPEAATPEVPSLDSLAHALFDAFWSQLPGEWSWERVGPEDRAAWLAVARTASDGASIAAKAVTDALAARLAGAKAFARRDQETFLAVSKAFEDERDDARAAVREICRRLRDKGLLQLLDLMPGWLERAGLDPSILEARDDG